MRKRAFGAAVALCLVAIALKLDALQIGGAPSLLLHTVPLADCGGLPCVTMTTASGQSLRLALDLGERNAYLTPKAVTALGLKTAPLQAADGSTIADVQQTTVTGAKLGELPMGDFPFMVVDDQSGGGSPKPGARVAFPADGVLTYGSFQNRVVRLDLHGHALGVSEPQTAAQECPGSCGPLAVKHFGQYGPVTIVAHGFTLNGHPFSAQIDTLFTGSVLLYPDALASLGWKKEKRERRPEQFPFTQGGLEAQMAKETAQVAFREQPLGVDTAVYLTVKEQAYSHMQFDATVGIAVLAQAVVNFDFKGMQMWLGPAAAVTAR